jgi:hypothetical protein
VRGDLPIDSEAFLMTDFVNLKINPTQSFVCAHRGRMCAYVYKAECTYYMSICVVLCF